jgi:hypothetical protein
MIQNPNPIETIPRSINITIASKDNPVRKLIRRPTRKYNINRKNNGITK